MRTRVLLVDDNELVLSALATMLRHHHDVSVAHDIDGALELAGRERFDVIVTDLDFGDRERRDGFWLLDEAGRRWGLRGLVLTGHDGEHAHHRVLRKPVGLESLRAEIARALEK
jgi:DNA-binding NarL/FixJ family response regulator